MALYESPFSKFMRASKLENPEWQDAQEEGRALLSDKKIDWGLRSQSESASVRQKSYPYDVNYNKHVKP